MKNFIKVLLVIIVLVGASGCSKTPKYAFTDFECSYFALGDGMYSKDYDMLVFRYTINNTTETNWIDEEFGQSPESNVLKLNKNEYEWYIPEYIDDPGRNYISIGQTHPKYVTEVLAGNHKYVTVCFAIAPSDWREDLKGKLTIKYAGMTYKLDITYDMFEINDF